MKNNATILKKIFPLLLILFSICLSAQEIELLDNTWYLQSITINSQIHEAPRLPEMTIQAFFGNNDMNSDMCCAGQLELQLTFNNNSSSFEINDVNAVIENCDENNLNNFRDLYVNFFQNNTTGAFGYEIQENPANIGLYLTLTITNPLGDTVVLYNLPHDLQVDFTIFGDEPPFQTQWHLIGVVIEGTSYPVSYETAYQTTVTFSKDGSFHSQLCGEIVSKAAFVNDDGGGPFGAGEFYILCENLTLIPGDCEGTSLTEIEQHFYNFLQNLANGNTAVYQRGHADFADFCGSIEMIDFYDAATNSRVYLVDCIEPLSTNSFNQNPIVFYPNPVYDIISIQTTDCNNCITKIYNTNGKLLYSDILRSSYEKINVKHLSNGVYFIVVENEVGIKQTQKFVKK